MWVLPCGTVLHKLLQHGSLPQATVPARKSAPAWAPLHRLQSAPAVFSSTGPPWAGSFLQGMSRCCSMGSSTSCRVGICLYRLQDRYTDISAPHQECLLLSSFSDLGVHRTRLVVFCVWVWVSLFFVGFFFFPFSLLTPLTAAAQHFALSEIHFPQGTTSPAGGLSLGQRWVHFGAG